MIRISDISMPLHYTDEALRRAAAKKLWDKYDAPPVLLFNTVQKRLQPFCYVINASLVWLSAIGLQNNCPRIIRLMRVHRVRMGKTILLRHVKNSSQKVIYLKH